MIQRRKARKVMILGAGMYQLGLIERAKSLGLESHVISRAGNFPGIPLADCFYPIDTTATSEIVSLARRLGIEGVVTSGTDVAIPTAGAVAEDLGLFGVSKSVAEIISCKDSFRAFQHAHGLRAPRHAVAESANHADKVMSQVRTPWIVKPVDSSGSRGVQRVLTAAGASARTAFEIAVGFSKSGRVCFEEELSGVEVGGNGLLLNGKIVFIAISQKFMEGFLVRGHAYPCVLRESQQQAVRAELERTCQALNYNAGALNFDVMIDGDTATVIEMGARLGGNGLTHLIQPSYGYDIETDVLRIAIGEQPDLKYSSTIKPSGSYVFGSARGGILRQLPNASELREVIPTVLDLQTGIPLGATVSPLSNNACQIGCVLFSQDEAESWHCIAREIQHCLDSTVVVD